MSIRDVDDWNADMDTWQLTPDQRIHHLWRLHAYHSALRDRHIASYDRATRLERWFAFAAMVALMVLILQLALGGAP